jgi:hypothetical protein
MVLGEFGGELDTDLGAKAGGMVHEVEKQRFGFSCKGNIRARD